MPSLRDLTSFQDPTFFQPLSQEERARRAEPKAVVGFDYGVGDQTSIVIREGSKIRSIWNDALFDEVMHMQRLEAAWLSANPPMMVQQNSISDVELQKMRLEPGKVWQVQPKPPLGKIRIKSKAMTATEMRREAWAAAKAELVAPVKCLDETARPINGVFDNLGSGWREEWRDGRMVQQLISKEKLELGTYVVPWGSYPDLPCPF